MGRRRRRTARATAPHRRPLRLEPLEDRRLLAVATVTTLDDTVNFTDGVTSLREAIFATNTVLGADTVEFAPALTASGPATIVLTMGELVISDSLTINGPGANLLAIDASGNDPTPDENNGDGSRVFNISDGNSATLIDATIQGLTITGGDVTGSGGGLLNMERMTLSEVAIESNTATSSGGAIRHEGGSLVVMQSEILANHSASTGVSGGGGGLSVAGGTGVEIVDSTLAENSSRTGGGIDIFGGSGTVSIVDSHVDRNWTTGGGAGGIWRNGNTTLNLVNSTVDNNTATGRGGGLEVLGNGLFLLENSSVSENRANGQSFGIAGGGGIVFNAAPGGVNSLVIRGSRIADNYAVFDGGGINASQSSQLVIEESEIVGNTAERNGGGIYLVRTGLVLRDSIVAENHATAGMGGGVNGGSGANLQLLQTLVRGNTSSGGGGGVVIVSGQSGTPDASTLLIRDSMVTGNSTAGDGGGIRLAGGIHALVNSTIADNSAGGNGGGVSSGSSPTTSTEMMQVTISGNQAAHSGGGISSSGTGMKISRSTIADNVADSDGSGYGVGGGIYDISSIVGISIDQTIIGDNRHFNIPDDLYKSQASQLRYSLVEKLGGSVGGSGVGNTFGADPKLGPLADNGGPVFLDGSRMFTHALLADSPAIDAGDPTGGTPALAAVYRAAVMGDVPRYYYRFEETSLGAGAKEEVSSQSSLAGFYSGSPTLGVAGAIPGSRAVEFDGVNDFVRSNSTSLMMGPKLTVEIWARSATETWNASGWIARSDVKNMFVINPIQGTKSWSALVYDTSGTAQVVGTFTPDDSVDMRAWHQFALTWDQATGAATMYFDGVGVAANTIVNTTPLATSVQLLTGFNDGTSAPAYGRGAVDELAVYNHVLPADAIAEHYRIAQLGAFDQRGDTYARIIDGDGISGPRIDIGALEAPLGESYALVVDSLVDENDGDYTAGDFSLREALAVANANPGAATIEFAPALTAGGPATILLMQGELAIANSMVIHGPGAHLLTIDASGNDPTPNSTLNDGVATNDGDGSRVLNIDDKTAATWNVEIVGLRLTGGDVKFQGGGVLARENLILRECIVDGNMSSSQGGGIYSATDSFSSNSLIVVDCAVSDNATGSEGGGIRKVIGDLTVDRSVIEGNQAGQVGGGISAANELVQVLIRDSLVQKNRNLGSGTFGGGGIFLFDAVATILNTSVVENQASTGGGIYSVDYSGTSTPGTAVTRIINSTVSGNIGNFGVGIYARGSTEISHSTVVGNTVTAPEARVYSTLIAGTGASGFDSIGYNIVNASATGIVGPLFGNGEHVFINGSRMRVHALMPGSPAVDAGNPADMAGVGSVPEFDQRGVPYGRVVNGDAVGSARIDIGAYERRGDEELSFVVDTLEDDDGDDYSPGDRSLREAIRLANAIPGVNSITFAPELTANGPSTILLKYGEMAITEAVVIDGPGADLITVDAQHQSRAFNITATTGDFEIHGLTLTHGKTTGNNVSGPNPYVFSGGAIRSVTLGNITIDDTHIIDSGTSGNGAGGGGVFAQGPVVLNRSVVSGNATMGNNAHGGGIFAHGPIVLNRSVVSGNTTAGEGSYGGGVATLGKIDVLDSVIDGNQVLGLNQGGGGIWSRGNVSLTQSVVSNNRVMNGSSFFSPTTGGGGVFVRNGSATVTDSSITGNSTVGVPGQGGGICVYQGTLAIARSIVSDNHAGGRGGGVSCRNTLTVDVSTISGNSAKDFGGGINGSSIMLSNSTVSGNSVSAVHAFYLGGGGGIAGSTLTVTNSTISGNSADGKGGGIYGSFLLTVTNSTISGNSAAAGGGLFTNGTTTVRHSTIAFNSTTGAGKGIFVNGGSLLLDHSIVARNTGTNGDVNGLLGTTITAKYSFVGNNQGSGQLPAPIGSPDANGNLIGTNSVTVNPYLSPLANNGGPTLTHALLPGSPAIDAGDPAAVAGEIGVPQFDQRGEPWARVVGGRIDMGAVEWQANPLPGDYNFNGVVDAADYSAWRDTVGSTNDLRADGDSDGMVDADDYEFWKANFGNVLAVGGGGALAEGPHPLAAAPFPHPLDNSRPLPEGEARYAAVAEPLTPERHVPAEPGVVGRVRVAAPRLDDALLAWFTQYGDIDAVDDRDGSDESSANAAPDSEASIFDEVFAELGCGLR